MIREPTDEEFLELSMVNTYTSYRYAEFMKNYECEVGIMVSPHPEGSWTVCGEPMFVFMLCYGMYGLEYLPYMVARNDFHSLSPNRFKDLETNRYSKPVFDEQNYISHWE